MLPLQPSPLSPSSSPQPSLLLLPLLLSCFRCPHVCTRAARQCAKCCAVVCAQADVVCWFVCTTGASRERASGWRRSAGARRARRAASGRARVAWGRAAASVGGASAAPPDIRGPFYSQLFNRLSNTMFVYQYQYHSILIKKRPNTERVFANSGET